MTQPEGTLTDLIPVTLIYDVALGSPVETQPLGGKVVGVPAERIPLPRRGRLFGQPGYSRQTGGAWEWVLQGTTDPVDAFVDSLTGQPSGWTDPTARAAVKLMVGRLFSAGIPRATIATQIPAFYQAVAAEIQAEHAAG